MNTFRRLVSAFSLVLLLGAAACGTSLVGPDDHGTTITHGSDN